MAMNMGLVITNRPLVNKLYTLPGQLPVAVVRMRAY
jgi:hypothetical protein